MSHYTGWKKCLKHVSKYQRCKCTIEKKKGAKCSRPYIRVYSWPRVSVVIECIFILTENTFTDNTHDYESALGDMERNWNDNPVNKKRQQHHILKGAQSLPCFTYCLCAVAVIKWLKQEQLQLWNEKLHDSSNWENVERNQISFNAQQCDWTVVDLNNNVMKHVFSSWLHLWSGNRLHSLSQAFSSGITVGSSYQQLRTKHKFIHSFSQRWRCEHWQEWCQATSLTASPETVADKIALWEGGS